MSASYSLLPQFRGQTGSMPWPRRSIWIAALVVIVLLFLVAANSQHATTYISGKRDNALLHDISNATLGFQQIFVINLKSRSDHRDGMALAAAVTGLNFTFFDAVTEVSTKALPPGGSELGMSNAHYGVWRSHLSIARQMIEENIQSALILEDDSDWDIRIKQQLTQYAQASRLLVQPLKGTTDQFLDPTYHGDFGDFTPATFVVGEHEVSPPTTSPYGDLDRWDMMWLGHCGATTPTGKDEYHTKTPLARAVILDEETVPIKKHINPEISPGRWREDYPEHSRVVFRTGGNVCTLGYALSQNGARRVLYDLAISSMHAPIDGELDSWCRGRDGRPLRTCLTVGPQYFQHHRPVGNWTHMTDISEEPPTGYNDKAFTTNIRWSARVNLPKLINGETDYIDQWPDE